MKARRESRERRTELKKEVKHNCPDQMHFDEKGGRCVKNGENLNEFNEDPSDRSKIPTKSLRFPHTLGKVRGVPQEKKN